MFCVAGIKRARQNTKTVELVLVPGVWSPSISIFPLNESPAPTHLPVHSALAISV